eukprot:TRINITY_DN2419_c0_g1_i1.p1 TRINITY_DN2419_c0_g1~~TRINITY_DN2419_c0_g1_i1.p1  ORF type:complete len:516 (+),score=51.40 TRINITY_DN2419_c0_g1_i1:101-1648(+)
MLKGLLKASLLPFPVRYLATGPRKSGPNLVQVKMSLAKLLATDTKVTEYPAKKENFTLLFGKYGAKLIAYEKEENDFLMLVKLPLLFGYDEKAYWTSLNTQIKKRLGDFTFKTKLLLVQLLRSFSKQSESAFEALVNNLLDKVQEAKPLDLIEVAIASCSLTNSAKSSITNTEPLILKHIESIPLPKLCELLNELYLNNLSQASGFLGKIKSHLIKCFAGVPKGSYKTLLSAYGSLCPLHYEEISRIVEEKSLSHVNGFTLHEVVDLVIAFSNYRSGSQELFLEFEKRVGKGLEQLDCADIAPVLAAFVNHGYYREKLLVHFLKKIKSNAHLFSAADMASLVETYTKAGAFSKVHDLLKPFIINNKGSLNPDSLLRVLYGYSSPVLAKQRQEVYRELEDVALQVVETGPAFHSIRTAYALTVVSKEGTHKFAQTVKKALEKEELANQLEAIGAMHLLEIVVELKGNKNLIEIAKKQVMRHISEYDKEDIAVISRCIAVDPRLNDLLIHIPKIQSC